MALTMTEIDSENRPLVVDLDGTLIRSDLLIETAFSSLTRHPLATMEAIYSLSHGKAALKHKLANSAEFDPSILPYDQTVLAYIQRATRDGRPVYLVSASNERLVEQVARHLAVFTGWLASDEKRNLSAEVKARELVERFGERGFDYIGNAAADLPVWMHAAKAVAIRPSASTARQLEHTGVQVERLHDDPPTWRTWIKALRVHQYAKNALVFVPLITAHQFSPGSIFTSLLAAISFSLCASSVYLLNDLVDLQSDRLHPTKRHRPLASGALSLIQGVCAVPILFTSAAAIAAFVSLPFLGVLLSYFVLTTAYSLVLKRKMLLDTVVLAMLYVMRVIGGVVAINVTISEWLLAFSMFIFMSLALIKRYVELAVRLDAGMPDPSNRNYKLGDLDVVAALAAAAGFNAVTVFALYISSDTVNQLYHRPELLWLICPVLLYWISRALMMAHRRLMDDDPIAFALKDRNSQIAAGLIALILLAAI